jgi:hypothetical protein
VARAAAPKHARSAEGVSTGRAGPKGKGHARPAFAFGSGLARPAGLEPATRGLEVRSGLPQYANSHELTPTAGVQITPEKRGIGHLGSPLQSEALVLARAALAALGPGPSRAKEFLQRLVMLLGAAGQGQAEKAS